MLIPVLASDKSTIMRPSPFLPRAKSTLEIACVWLLAARDSAKRVSVLVLAVAASLPCKVIITSLPLKAVL